MYDIGDKVAKGKVMEVCDLVIGNLVAFLQKLDQND